jgi:hypothetical protein
MSVVYDTYVKSGYARKISRDLGIYLRISTIPQRRTIHGIVNK